MNAVSRLTSHLHAGPRSVAPVRSILKPAPAVLHFRSAVPTKHSLRRSNVVLASFLPDAVDNVLTTSTLVAAGLAILGSAALTVRVDRLPESVQRQKQDEEGFEYGVMGFISFIPLFNWTVCALHACMLCAHHVPIACTIHVPSPPWPTLPLGLCLPHVRNNEHTSCCTG